MPAPDALHKRYLARKALQDSPIHQHIAERVTSMLRARNMCAWDLCVKGGPRSSKTIYNIISIETTTTIQTLEKVAEAFGCKLVVDFVPRD